MAIIVGTNSYVNVADTNAYFLTRMGNTAWGSALNDTKESALITATDMIDNEYRFIGVAVSVSQALAWPRRGAHYVEPRRNALVTPNEQETPTRVVRAVQELAAHLIENATVLDDNEQTFERIKIGPIELTDSSTNYQNVPRFPSSVNNLLAPLLVFSSRTNTWWRAN